METSEKPALSQTGTMSNSEAKESVAGLLTRTKYLALGQGEGRLEDVLERGRSHLSQACKWEDLSLRSRHSRSLPCTEPLREVSSCVQSPGLAEATGAVLSLCS